METPTQIVQNALTTERARHLTSALARGEPDSEQRRAELAGVVIKALETQYAFLELRDPGRELARAPGHAALSVPRPAQPGEWPPYLPRPDEPWSFVDLAAVLLAAGMCQPVSTANVPRVAYERALELDQLRRARLASEE
jgi:hypothetical protein